ncbi:MAG: hypothetical protein ACREUW_11840 [Burkholderiales bacterium]
MPQPAASWKLKTARTLFLRGLRLRAVAPQEQMPLHMKRHNNSALRKVVEQLWLIQQNEMYIKAPLVAPGMLKVVVLAAASLRRAMRISASDAKSSSPLAY